MSIFGPNIRTLKKSGDIEGLIQAFGNNASCAKAHIALEEIGEAAVESLIQALDNSNEQVRENVAEALGEIGDARAVEPLIQALYYDDNFDVRGSAAEALGEIGDARALEPLIQTLHADDSNVRGCAAWALGELSDARAVAPLVQALQDEERLVRSLAVIALRKIGDVRAYSALKNVATDDPEDFVRDAAKDALQKLLTDPRADSARVAANLNYKDSISNSAREQTVLASSAVNYQRTMMLYKVKVENRLSKPISDITVKAFVPDVFLLKEEEKTIGILEPNNARTVTFEIRPTGEYGECNLSGKITYYNHLIDKREEIEIPVKAVSIICPLLKAREISEDAWRTLNRSLIEASENTKDEIPIAAKSLFNMVTDIVKDLNLYLVGERVTEDDRFFRGVARFYGEGVKGLKYAAQIEAIGGTKKSQLILKSWAEREDALTGFYYKILDEIEKRVRIKDYIDNSIVQQFYQIGTVIKDSVVQRSTISGSAEAGEKCIQCGKEVSGDERFCPDCGTQRTQMK